MTLDQDVLERLYARLIVQAEYPGQTCPTEHVMVAYESGMLPQDQGELLEEHFAECPSCREDLIDMGRAAQWFREHEPSILLGLAAKGADSKVLPWAKCPSSQLLYRYVNGQIPDTSGGRILLTQMREHLGRCPECLRLSDRLRATKDSVCLSILNLGVRAGHAIQNQLTEFIDALVAAGQACGGPSWSRGAPGYRSGKVPALAAPVVDSTGCLVVDDEGKPCQCHFDVGKANIQGDGFLTLALAATGREYCRTGDSCYQACAAILAGDVRLELPATPIDEGGQVTFTGMLGEVQPVDPLPLSMIDVTVTQTGESDKNG